MAPAGLCWDLFFCNHFWEDDLDGSEHSFAFITGIAQVEGMAAIPGQAQGQGAAIRHGDGDGQCKGAAGSTGNDLGAGRLFLLIVKSFGNQLSTNKGVGRKGLAAAIQPCIRLLFMI